MFKRLKGFIQSSSSEESPLLRVASRLYFFMQHLKTIMGKAKKKKVTQKIIVSIMSHYPLAT